MREKISQGAYEITFSYINDYQDSAEVVVNANVSGALEDLTVTLQSETVDIPVGAEFVAEDYIQEISDPSGNGSNVSVSSNVDTLHEGTYEVRYTVISTDRTQKATKVLKVTVR